MKSLKNLALVAMTSLVLASCGTTQQVPLTGRTHRISVSDEQVLSLSNQEYTKYMASAKIHECYSDCYGQKSRSEIGNCR